MGVFVNFLVGFVSYTVLNVWILSIVVPIFLIKFYIKYSTGHLTVVNQIEGKTAIVTGANNGIGFETAHLLAARGARVILACRNLGSAHQAKAKLIELTGNENIEVYRLDLSSLWSIRQFAQEVLAREDRLDILINNAGVGALRNKKTDDDIQITWQINHFGPFLLTNLLLDLMKKTAPSRIIFVSSIAHHFHSFNLEDLDCRSESYSAWTTYCNTKLANILTAKHLSRKLQGTGITVNSVHPGLVNTQVFKRVKNKLVQKVLNIVFDFFSKNPEEGAATSAYLAMDWRLDNVTGKYFSDCKESHCMATAAGNLVLAERLWRKSEEIVDLKEDEKFV